MMPENKRPLKLFYCYARRDKDLRDELHIHLSSLRRQNLISGWYDGEVGVGQDWKKEIDTYLQEAHIILLLVTPHFMASDYCYDVAMQRALKRHRAGKARVIPIILRPTIWENSPFSFIQALPTNAKPLAQWSDRDEAFWSIAIDIYVLVGELQVLLKTAQDWVTEGNALYNLKHYEEAIATYNEAIRFDPKYALAHNNKGAALNDLKRYEDAIAAYDLAIRLDPKYTLAYNNKGNALFKLKRYDDAIAAYDLAILLDPNLANAYDNKNIALNNLKNVRHT
jgi:tetratricopeptide (TPR) repeat protein